MSNVNSQPSGTHKTLLKSTSILAVGTLSSRILGFLRNIVLAKLFGTGLQADVFFLALRIPNLFRDLVGEGAANSAVVPVLSEYQVKKDPHDFWRLVSAISFWALIILSLITVGGMTFAPWIVQVIAPGFAAEAGKLKLATDLTRVMFPYLILIGLTAHSMGVLATFRSFASVAFSPCLFNIAVIIAALYSRHFAEPTYVLAYGVLCGGVLQLFAQIPSMLKLGMRWDGSALAHPGAKQCGRLLVPRLFGSGVYQLNVMVDTVCASLATIVGPGGISAIFYANQLIQLPLGVFGYAMATAALPDLSMMAAQSEKEKFRQTVSESLENIFFIMFPAMVLMILLSETIVRVLFQRGQFGVYSTTVTSLALTFYSVGLYSFGGVKILTTSFYALKDTKTPVKIAAICLVINAVLNVVLMRPMAIGGIALGSALASTVNFFLLLLFLEKRIGTFSNQLPVFVLKIIGASVLSGGIVKMMQNVLKATHISEMIVLMMSVTAGLGVYSMACHVLKVPQIGRIQHIFRK